MDDKPFLGLRTVVYPVPDIQAAKEWYARILGFPPYFDEPFYVGFNVGGYELGLDPDLSASKPGSDGPHAYWGVEDAASALKRLLEMGAREHRPLQEVGGGIKVASVLDPFGNAFGVIENPHFQLP